MTLHIVHSAIYLHTLVLTLVVGVQLWTPSSQSRSFRANLEPRINLLINLRRSTSWVPVTGFICSKGECFSAKLVWHKQKSLFFLVWCEITTTEQFFWNTVKKWIVQSGKERKDKKNPTVNVQLRARKLTSHMGPPAVTTTGSSCRCHSLDGAAWLFPGGNAQVSMKPRLRGCRGRRPMAKESQLESEGPAEEKIDIRLNQETKPKKNINCFILFFCITLRDSPLDLEAPWLQDAHNSACPASLQISWKSDTPVCIRALWIRIKCLYNPTLEKCTQWQKTIVPTEGK